MDYLYDGSFDGLLTCIYYNYYGEEATGIYPEREYQHSMLTSWHVVSTDVDKADKVYGGITRKIGSYDLGRVYKVFLSNAPGKENIILEYLKFGFKQGHSAWQFHGDDRVYAFQQIAYRIDKELDHLRGLLRFSMLEGDIAFAKVDPDSDVIELLAHHFSDRFGGAPFIIYDEKRCKAVIGEHGRWEITTFEDGEISSLAALDENEEAYRKMWRNYYDTIAIKQRINSKCRRNMMPLRYWKNLTEIQLPPDVEI